MRIVFPFGAAALTLFLCSGASAFEAAAPDTEGGAAVRSARSIACSQKADSQDLHGKPRKRFMRECKHAQ